MPLDQGPVRVTVDGRVREAPRGTTILKAALDLGIHIPTLCWHPKVSILGACRICLVEVEGLNKLVASCQTPVAPGMVVRTATPLVRQVRRTMLELLLAKHPLDCLQCDKGGWCDLQELTFRYGPEKNRFEIPRPDYLPQDHSPFIERDTKKCILCRRCIRVCKEVRGVQVWGAMYRGFDKKIATFFEQPLGSDFHDPFRCEFCGSCVDICPVGALTAKTSKHKSRPWEVRRRELTCPFCGVGCRTTAHYRKGELVKTTPVGSPGDDFSDLCFRGRFGTAYVNHPSRLTSCLMRRGGELVPVGRAAALDFLAARLREGAAGVAAAVGTQASEQEAHHLASLLAGVAPGSRVLALDSRGEAEEGPFPLFDEAKALGVAGISAARKLLVIGSDFTFTHPVAGIRVRQAVAGGARMLLVDPYDTLLGRHAAWWLRPPGGSGATLLEAMADALRSSGGIKRLADLVRAYPGMDHPLWPAIIEWLGAPGEVTVVLQKVPGGVHGRVRRAVAMLAGALAGADWKVCALPLDADGHGVPLGLAAAGFHGGERLLDELLAPDAAPSPALFLRCDPLGESPRRGEWERLREKGGAWVAFDPFLTATAARADLVFPLPHYLEGPGTVLAAGGPGEHLRLWNPPAGIVPLGTLLAEVAAALGRDPGPLRGAPDPPAMRAAGIAALRRALAVDPRVSLPLLAAPRAGEGEFLLSLRHHRFPGHRLGLVQARRIIGPAERLELNPADARRLGLAEGGTAAVVLDGARFVFSVTMTPRIPPGQAALPLDPEFARVGDLATLIGRRGMGPVAVRLEKE